MGRVGGQCPVRAPSTWSEPTAPGEGSQALPMPSPAPIILWSLVFLLNFPGLPPKWDLKFPEREVSKVICLQDDRMF